MTQTSTSGIRLLLDNTMVHRIGHVLEYDQRRSLRPIDGLALFHLAEHILFCESLVVSNFERVRTFERTSAIVESLNNRGLTESDGGLSLLSIEPFSKEAYAAACEKAAWRLLDELTELSGVALERLGEKADETTRPHQVPVPTFNHWLSEDYQLSRNPDHIERLEALRAEGAFELILAVCKPLRARVRELAAGDPAGLTVPQAAALSALMRVQINEELARAKDAVYSPAPQRARIAEQTNELFRHRVEELIQRLVSEQYSGPASKTLQCLATIDRLPLPLFAFHVLRSARTRSPQQLLEAARKARDAEEIVWLRGWLTRWERQSLSARPEGRLRALQELDRVEKEIADHLRGGAPRAFASLHVGDILRFDPVTSFPTWSLPMAPIVELLNFVMRRYDRKRLFLAKIAGNLAVDKDLGLRFLKQVGLGIASLDSGEVS